MKTILSCTDGSIYSNSVYDHTAWAAKRVEAAVHVVHMLDPQANLIGHADLSGNLDLDSGRGLLDEMVQLEQTKKRVARERGKLILQQAREHLEASGVATIKTEQQHGLLVDALVDLERDADLVVLGKRGESADFAKLHLGSNLERVIRASIRPVLVTSRQFEPVDRFLIAYDGGPSVEKAVAFACDSPLLKGLECHLVRAGKIDEKAEWYLQEAAGKLREAGYTVQATATPGEPEKVIAEMVSRLSINLLVMGAYGHSRLLR
jgi:nucleotide-binding universal stress UspA family protein